MSAILLIDDDPDALSTFEAILRLRGHVVFKALSGSQGLDCLRQRPIDVTISDLQLPDISGLDILRVIRGNRKTVPFIIVTELGSTKDTVEAMRLGATAVLEKPICEDDLIETLTLALTTETRDHTLDNPEQREAHAAGRWARCVIRIIDSSRDPRTISEWSALVAASDGAIRNWCRTAGIKPRRSLVLGRLIRAIFLGRGQRHQLQNVLDVVDRRTMVGLLRFAGLKEDQDLPQTVKIVHGAADPGWCS